MKPFQLAQFVLFALLSCSTERAIAFDRHHPRPAVASSAQCYDPSDPNDIRLWEHGAPGAVGGDACRDIPFIRVYPASQRLPRGNTAILVIPGGGYDRLSEQNEQGPVAQYLSERLGVTAFVLYYRLVQSDGTYRYPIPMWDGQRALRLIRSRAKQFGIAPDRIGLFGFSAGGHLSATLTLHSATDFHLPIHDGIDEVNAMPNFLGLGYPVISMNPAQFAPPSSFSHLLFGYSGSELQELEIYLSAQDNVSVRTPPVFLFESMDDRRISPENSVLFVDALRAQGIPVDAHLFQHGVHGAGLATDIPEESAWPGYFARWLGQQGLLY